MDKLITHEQMKRIANIPQIKERSLNVDTIHEIFSKAIVIGGKFYWRMSDVKEWLKKVKEGIGT